MHLVRWIVLVPFAAVVVSFAVSNLQSVTVRLLPLPFSLESPLYLLVLLVALLAFFVGALVLWASSVGARRRARRSEEQVARLEREVADLQRKLDVAQGETEKARREQAAPRAALPQGGPAQDASRPGSGPLLDHSPDEMPARQQRSA